MGALGFLEIAEMGKMYTMVNGKVSMDEWM
jgi:hypothetical protein